tara:strand:- start:218 stop:547 length:330 start_codon:yes stop_codon:yes gene_type:complete
MSLSKKNIDKLNNFINNKNLINECNAVKTKNTNKNHKPPENSPKSEDPAKIFYSLIDNSQNLNETSEINHTLRNSEKDYFNINSRNADYSNNLTTEDELYDEFNYLLEE